MKCIYDVVVVVVFVVFFVKKKKEIYLRENVPSAILINVDNMGIIIFAPRGANSIV